MGRTLCPLASTLILNVICRTLGFKLQDFFTQTLTHARTHTHACTHTRKIPSSDYYRPVQEYHNWSTHVLCGVDIQLSNLRRTGCVVGVKRLTFGNKERKKYKPKKRKPINTDKTSTVMQICHKQRLWQNFIFAR
jgi:hypothetical protein